MSKSIRSLIAKFESYFDTAANEKKGDASKKAQKATETKDVSKNALEAVETGYVPKKALKTAETWELLKKALPAAATGDISKKAQKAADQTCEKQTDHDTCVSNDDSEKRKINTIVKLDRTMHVEKGPVTDSYSIENRGYILQKDVKPIYPSTRTKPLKNKLTRPVIPPRHQLYPAVLPQSEDTQSQRIELSSRTNDKNSKRPCSGILMIFDDDLEIATENGPFGYTNGRENTNSETDKACEKQTDHDACISNSDSIQRKIDTIVNHDRNTHVEKRPGTDIDPIDKSGDILQKDVKLIHPSTRTNPFQNKPIRTVIVPRQQRHRAHLPMPGDTDSQRTELPSRKNDRNPIRPRSGNLWIFDDSESANESEPDDSDYIESVTGNGAITHDQIYSDHIVDTYSTFAKADRVQQKELLEMNPSITKSCETLSQSSDSLPSKQLYSEVWSNSEDTESEIMRQREATDNVVICNRGSSILGTTDGRNSKTNVTQTVNKAIDNDARSRTMCGIHFGNISVKLTVGNLTEQTCGVVVGNCTRGMDLSRGTISTAILCVAGPAIQTQCYTNYPKGIEYGEVAVLPPCNMSCSHIYLCALPKYNDTSVELLKMLVTGCIHCAVVNKEYTISFPAFGAGDLEYPPNITAKCMLKAIRKFSKHHRRVTMTVNIVLHDVSSSLQNNQKPFMKVFQQYSSVQTSAGGVISQPKPDVRQHYRSGPNNARSGKTKGFQQYASLPRSAGGAFAKPKTDRQKYCSDLRQRVGGTVSQPKTNVFRQLSPCPNRTRCTDCQQHGSKRKICIHPPDYWTHHTNNIPKQDWQSNSERHPYYVVELKKGQDEFQIVKRLVLETWENDKVGYGSDAKGLMELDFNGVKVRNVQRVENVQLYEKYANRRAKLFHKAGGYKCPSLTDLQAIRHGGLKTQDILKSMQSGWLGRLCDEVNEGYIFHGTKADSIESMLLSGVDVRMANETTVYGPAIYMAESSTKADQYTDDRSQRRMNGLQMIMCRACLGEVKVMKKTQRFRRPPCLIEGCTNDKCSHARYDSIVEEDRFIFREFIVYDTYQVYPEYIITYDRIREKPKRSRSMPNLITDKLWF